MRRWLVALLLALAAPATADTPLPDPAREAQAQALMRTLRCIVCQHESIAESQADVAVEMRAIVREQLRGGATPAEVKTYLVSRYGDWVSFAPPVAGRALPLWLAPLLLLGLGGLLARSLFARRGA